jgi:3-oxoacyl-[acyl-carrier-protein] synthase-1
MAPYDCRNNRLARLALEQDGFVAAVASCAARLGASRVGVFVGTSTSGVRETEKAYAHQDVDNLGLPRTYRYHQTHCLSSLAIYVRSYLQLGGPALVVSTACSSSAKAMVAAHRYLAGGVCDAAVVGGVDSLCLTTLYGFRSLDLLSSSPCKPWDRDRSGINIGEAAGFVLLEKDLSQEHGVKLLGSDGYHMSTPHPRGAGAAFAIERALESAVIESAQVDYVNLHGTGTSANDAAEDAAVVRTLGSGTPCSSTKGWTGHTLGAAGIAESILTCLCIENDLIIGTRNSVHRDPKLSADIRLRTESRGVNIALTNSFGFGGSNCSLVFGKASV